MAERNSTPPARGAESVGGSSAVPGGGSMQTPQHTTAGLSARMREQANERLSSQKDRALDGIGGITEAVRTTTQSLRDQHHDTVAQYVEQAADHVDRLTGMLKKKDVGELIEDVQRLARRQPAVFIGSAFAVGLLAARFLKSSSPAPQRSGEYGNPAAMSAPSRPRIR